MTSRSTVVQLIQSPIGRQACLLTAVPYLQANINRHIQMRKSQGLSAFPSITMVHTTHYLPLSNAFKPCVICAFEYVRTTECLNQGANTEIELKQNCDYINDMYIEVDTPSVSCSQQSLPDIVVKPKDLDVYKDIVTEDCLSDMLNQIKTKNIKLDVEHEVFRDNPNIIPVVRIVEAHIDAKGIWVKAVLKEN
jgi:hypothetical protein